MNLLIEQRSTSIIAQLQQTSSLTSHYDMNNSSSSSLVLKLKRPPTHQQQENEPHANSMANEDASRSTPTTNSRLKRAIATPSSTATAGTRRASSPAFNGKQQASKRSVTIDNNNNDLTSNHLDENSATKRFKTNEFHSTATKVDASVETVSIGLATEPDQLGPCEPGTSVVLEGIVWNETDSGVLVVNVTWRGKTYVGTLLDSTKQDWACPRLICESPTSDYDPRHSSKSSRTKRANLNRLSHPSSLSSFASSMTATLPVSGVDDRKLRHNIKSRQSKRTNPSVTDETSIGQSSPLPSPCRSNTTFFPAEPKLIPCSEALCHKQFASIMALNFHISDAHRKVEETPTPTSLPPPPPSAPPPPPPLLPVPSTRDEEDVAHILVNVAEYVRRSSPPSSKRASPEHQRPTGLSWPCPQISSKMVLSSPLSNNEQTTNSSSTNTNRSVMNGNETNQVEHEEVKSILSTFKPADHFLLHIQDEPALPSATLSTSSPPSLNGYSAIPSWMNTTNESTKPPQIPSPTPLSSSSASTFVPIHPIAITQNPPTSTSPAYSDISDEDSTSRTDNDQILAPLPPPPPSTINLLTANHEKLDEHEQTFIPNTRWTTQMLLQQYGSYMQQPAPPFVGTNTKESSSNRLNSKNPHSLSSNGPSDSTVKNILDARRLSTSKSSSPATMTNDSHDYSKNLYHYHNNGLTSDALINTLTSPNENLLKPSVGNPLDYSLTPPTCSSTIHTSR